MRYFYQNLFFTYPQKFLKTKFIQISVFKNTIYSLTLTKDFSTFLTPVFPNEKLLKK